jgi:hypothetical protein
MRYISARLMNRKHYFFLIYYSVVAGTVSAIAVSIIAMKAEYLMKEEAESDKTILNSVDAHLADNEYIEHENISMYIGGKSLLVSSLRQMYYLLFRFSLQFRFSLVLYVIDTRMMHCCFCYVVQLRYLGSLNIVYSTIYCM